jgi:hypothetical protein
VSREGLKNLCAAMGRIERYRLHADTPKASPLLVKLRVVDKRDSARKATWPVATGDGTQLSLFAGEAMLAAIGRLFATGRTSERESERHAISA